MYPMPEVVLHHISDPYGVVEGMEIFQQTDDVVVFVEYGSCHDALQAFRTLQGRHIYDGCCQLDIKYALA